MILVPVDGPAPAGRPIAVRPLVRLALGLGLFVARVHADRVQPGDVSERLLLGRRVPAALGRRVRRWRHRVRRVRPERRRFVLPRGRVRLWNGPRVRPRAALLGRPMRARRVHGDQLPGRLLRRQHLRGALGRVVRHGGGDVHDVHGARGRQLLVHRRVPVRDSAAVCRVVDLHRRQLRRGGVRTRDLPERLLQRRPVSGADERPVRPERRRVRELQRRQGGRQLRPGGNVPVWNGRVLHGLERVQRRDVQVMGARPAAR